MIIATVAITVALIFAFARDPQGEAEQIADGVVEEFYETANP